MDQSGVHEAKISDLQALKEKQEKEIRNLLQRIDITLQEYGKRIREVESFNI